MSSAYCFVQNGWDSEKNNTIRTDKLDGNRHPLISRSIVADLFDKPNEDSMSGGRRRSYRAGIPRV
jgi:hypothetical protein